VNDRLWPDPEAPTAALKIWRLLFQHYRPVAEIIRIQLIDDRLVDELPDLATIIDACGASVLHHHDDGQFLFRGDFHLLFFASFPGALGCGSSTPLPAVTGRP
jgi:hypothetical protein